MECLRALENIIKEEILIVQGLTRDMKHILSSFGKSPEVLEGAVKDVYSMTEQYNTLVTSKTNVLKEVFKSLKIQSGQLSSSLILSHLEGKERERLNVLLKTLSENLEILGTVRLNCYRMLEFYSRFNKDMIEVLTPLLVYNYQGQTKQMYKVTTLNNKV